MNDIRKSQTVTIKRGKLSGQAGEVIETNGKSIVLKLADGTFTVQNETNVKAPEVPTIAADRLAEVIQNAIDTEGLEQARLALADLAGELERDLPGIRERITLPGSVA